MILNFLFETQFQSQLILYKKIMILLSLETLLMETLFKTFELLGQLDQIILQKLNLFLLGLNRLLQLSHSLSKSELLINPKLRIGHINLPITQQSSLKVISDQRQQQSSFLVINDNLSD